MTELLVDWCDYRAAKWAVEHWHYSKRMPKSKLVKIGVWEDRQFIGVVIFGVGATPEIGKEFGLNKFQMCELVRVALNNHNVFVSKIISRCIKLLHKQSPKIRLIVSFADTAQEHLGSIYQASNWVYTGSKCYHAYKVLGNIEHPRTLYDRYGVGGQSIDWLHQHIDPKAERIITDAKHRYLYPLDKAMRRQILPLAQPYPKRDHADT